jgi:hypothetical protein
MTGIDTFIVVEIRDSSANILNKVGTIITIIIIIISFFFGRFGPWSPLLWRFSKSLLREAVALLSNVRASTLVKYDRSKSYE